MKLRNILLSFAFVGVVSVSAQPGAGEYQPGKMPMMLSPGAPMGMHSSIENPPPLMMDLPELQKLMAEINIDKSVSAKIIIIARTFLKALDERILKIQREELNIKEELLKDKPDLQVIQAAINRKTVVLGEIEFTQIKRDLEIKSLLTAEEYDRWKSSMRQKMRQMMPALMNRPGPNEPVNKTPPQK